MSKFEDWLILGGIVIAVGLFMRIKMNSKITFTFIKYLFIIFINKYY